MIEVLSVAIKDFFFKIVFEDREEFDRFQISFKHIPNISPFHLYYKFKGIVFIIRSFIRFVNIDYWKHFLF
jgi:hypothetical protein